MFSLRVRIVLAVIAAAYGAYKLANGQQSAIVLLIAVALIVFGYFRYGAIRPAFLAMRRGDLQTARKHIESIKFPELLSAQSRAYFQWVSAFLTLEDSGDTNLAVKQMELAIDGKLRTSNDRCVATAMLAQIIAKGGDPQQAAIILDQAERIPHREITTAYLNEVRSAL